MRIALDTAVLIDYGHFGSAIWDDAEFEPAVEAEYAVELKAFGQLMQLWLTRDLRFHVFDRQLSDAKRTMTDESFAVRSKQVRQLRAALDCLGHGTHGIDLSGDPFWSKQNAVSLDALEANADRDLLELAAEAGCHVFLTRDKALLRKRVHLLRYQVATFSPRELWQALVGSGQNGLFGDGGDLLMPDMHKWSHAFAACESAH